MLPRSGMDTSSGSDSSRDKGSHTAEGTDAAAMGRRGRCLLSAPFRCPGTAPRGGGGEGGGCEFPRVLVALLPRPTPPALRYSTRGGFAPRGLVAVVVVGREPQARRVWGHCTGCPHIRGVFGPRHLWVLQVVIPVSQGSQEAGSLVLSCGRLWGAQLSDGIVWSPVSVPGGARLWPQLFRGSLTFFCPSLDFCQAFSVWVQCPMIPSSSVTRQKAWRLRGRSLQ